MNKRLLVILGVGGLSVACAAVAVERMGVQSAEAAPVTVANAAPPGPTDPAAVPVLVELFTSEGCSSCPPADRVLAGLERAQSVAGARIVPLGLHVDYWDGIGWPDPFSSARMTERQRSYAVLHSSSYTPQAVIDGRAEMVGSRRAAVEQAVAEAAKRPHASITIDVAERADTGVPVEVTLKIGALPAGSGADAEAIVTLTQNAVRVAVPSGENAGSTLEHTAVARELTVAGAVPAAGASLKATLKVPPGLTAKDLRIVAFVQERSSRRVLATSTRDVGSR
jgi:hypothetical protein